MVVGVHEDVKRFFCHGLGLGETTLLQKNGSKEDHDPSTCMGIVDGGHHDKRFAHHGQCCIKISDVLIHPAEVRQCKTDAHGIVVLSM